MQLRNFLYIHRQYNYLLHIIHLYVHTGKNKCLTSIEQTPGYALHQNFIIALHMCALYNFCTLNQTLKLTIKYIFYFIKTVQCNLLCLLYYLV
jgi:hypothetical protein